MGKIVQLSPSLLAANFWKLGEQIGKIEQGGADMLHVDVMDGLFVPNLSFGIPIIQNIRRNSAIFMDVHLMIDRPERMIEQYVKAGADAVTIHLEASAALESTFKRIKELGALAGLSIKPDTHPQALWPYMDFVDLILVMSVEPGAGGQAYIPQSTEKIRQVSRLIEKSGREIMLSVDGGIGRANIREVVEAGANVVVAGTAVFGATDIAKAIEELKSIAIAEEE